MFFFPADITMDWRINFALKYTVILGFIMYTQLVSQTGPCKVDKVTQTVLSDTHILCAAWWDANHISLFALSEKNDTDRKGKRNNALRGVHGDKVNHRWNEDDVCTTSKKWVGKPGSPGIEDVTGRSSLSVGVGGEERGNTPCRNKLLI